jgi:hypothetical protein
LLRVADLGERACHEAKQLVERVKSSRLCCHTSIKSRQKSPSATAHGSDGLHCLRSLENRSRESVPSKCSAIVRAGFDSTSQDAFALPLPSGFARITQTLQHAYRAFMTALPCQAYPLHSREGNLGVKQFRVCQQAGN